MRRLPVFFTVLTLSALGLVGCASPAPGDAASCERNDADSSALDLIDVSGAVGSPAVSVDAPVHVDATSFQDVTVGEGTAVTTRAQDVEFTVAIANGTTGETLVASGTEVTPVTTWAEHYEGIAQMLECATEGSRIVGAIPTSDLSENAVAGLGLAEDESAVLVLDLDRVYLPAADGAPVYNDRAGMPSVVLDPDGRPGIIVPAVDAPDELVVEVLKQGDGEEVSADDEIRIHYTGVTWADGEVFDSTWQNGASAAVTLDGVVPGFADALEGQAVGSQLLVVIPPDLGYGDEATGSIPADSTLVFVIDILGVDEAPAA